MRWTRWLRLLVVLVGIGLASFSLVVIAGLLYLATDPAHPTPGPVAAANPTATATPRPSPTPTASLLSADERAYLDAVKEDLAEGARASERISALIAEAKTDSTRLTDPSWQAELEDAFATFRRLAEEERQRTVPPRLRRVHASYLGVLDTAARAGDLLLRGIRENDPLLVDRAAVELATATVHQQKLRAELFLFGVEVASDATSSR